MKKIREALVQDSFNLLFEANLVATLGTKGNAYVVFKKFQSSI